MKRSREEEGREEKEVQSWKELGLCDRLVEALRRVDQFPQATPVQQQAIPVMLKGRDVLIRSQTGSGKTLAFLLPILDGLARREDRFTRADGTFVVVIAPTRELVVQIVEETQAITRQGLNWIVPGYLIGGEKKKAEKARLRKGITILVATPGRLLDHLRTTESFDLRNLSYLVFDECDRLLDMGFEKDVRAITEELKNKSRSNRVPQTALVSATLWEGVMTLASLALVDPVQVDLEAKKHKASSNNSSSNAFSNASDDDEDGEEKDAQGGDQDGTGAPPTYTGSYDKLQQFSTPETLQQHYMVVPCKQRLVTLVSFIQWQLKHQARIIVFLSACAEVDFLYAILSAKIKCPFYKLHGQMAQIDRVKSFTAFRSKKAAMGAVLLCSDAAARGLDFPQVRWIIQYDPPGAPKEYIHRVGRTARIGNDGRALLFLMPHETEYVSLMQSHGVAISAVDMDKIPSGPGAITSADLEQFVDGKRELQTMAMAAFGAFVKAYATHAHGTKHIFHPKALHFGHVAKSFALSAAPIAFRKATSTEGREGAGAGSPGGGRQMPRDRTKGTSGKTLANPYAKAVASEFDAGI